MLKIIILSVLVLLYSTRAYLRTFDWRNSTELFLSCVRDNPSDLYKGLRLECLAGVCVNDGGQKEQCLRFLNDGIYFLNKVLNKTPKEAPRIIKFYGLDDESQKAKAAYILSFVLSEQKVKNPFKVLETYEDEITDTQIIHHYLAYLVQNNYLDRVEKLCNRVVKIKKVPPVLVGLSVVQQRKYKDFKLAEAYLVKGLKLFPYDLMIIQEALRFYAETKQWIKYKDLMQKYQLRIHIASQYAI